MDSACCDLRLRRPIRALLLGAAALMVATTAACSDDEISAPVPVEIGGTVTAFEAPTPAPTFPPRQPTTVASVEAQPTVEPNLEQSPEPTPQPESTIEEFEATPEPSPAATVSDAVVGPVPTNPPRFWKVTGITDELNARAEPGNDGQVVGSLAADARWVFGMGDIVTADGRDWMRINFGDESSFAWVAADFLTPDQNPSPPPDTTECYWDLETGTSALIEFTDAATFFGVVRIEQADAVNFEIATGQFTAGSLGEAVVTDQQTLQSRTEMWSFGPGGLSTDNRVIAFTDCDVIAGWVFDMLVRFPDL